MKTKQTLMQFYLVSWLLLVVPAIVQAQFTFTTNSDDTITLTQYTGSNSVVVIPAATNGYPVTSLGDGSFSSTNIISVTIPGSVTDLGSYAFGDYATSGALGYPINLTPVSVYFPGNAPNWDYDFSGFSGTDTLTVYYLPGASGWFLIPFGNAFSTLWLPQAQTTDASFGVKTNQFGFNINWASGQTVVVEACTNLSNPDWQPVATNTLATGSAYFSDPQWTNYFTRFYRLTSQ